MRIHSGPNALGCRREHAELTLADESIYADVEVVYDRRRAVALAKARFKRRRAASVPNPPGSHVTPGVVVPELSGPTWTAAVEGVEPVGHRAERWTLEYAWEQVDRERAQLQRREKGLGTVLAVAVLVCFAHYLAGLPVEAVLLVTTGLLLLLHSLHRKTK